MEDRLFTFPEVAERLSVSLSFIKQLRREGKLRTVRLGRKAVRVPAAEVARLCSGKEVA
ncbi:MAG: helix-turn-helix domain-containing protein [Chloroflexi bacterium]|nr:helix-turn-helix domain-containing protein [Chloroflexota bacterium]